MYTIALRPAYRRMTFWPALLALLAFPLIAILEITWAWRVAELAVPLAFAVHVALLFAPSDEPALELILTAPRPLRWLIAERAIVIVAMHTAVAAILITLILLRLGDRAGAIGAALHGETFATTSGTAAALWLRVISAAIYLGGLSFLVSIVLRRSAFGILLSVLVVIAWEIGGATVAYQYPIAILISPFWLPNFMMGEWMLYFYNRLGLIAVGAAALAVAALRLRTIDGDEHLRAAQEG